MSDSPSKHPLRPRRLNTSVSNYNLLHNCKDGTRLAWRLDNLKENVETTGDINSILESDGKFWSIGLDRDIVSLKCERCKEPAGLRVRGCQGTTGYYNEIFCHHTSTCGWTYSNVPKSAKVNKNLPVHIMKAILSILVGDIAPRHFKEVLLAYGLKVPGPQYFYSVMHMIFDEFSHVFDAILKANRQKVKEHYINIRKVKPIGGKVNIIVSSDGCYTRRAFKSIFESRFCIAFMVDCHTGTVVDLQVIQKCTADDCMSKPLFSLNDCPDGNFHGASKSLEVSAVLALYERSAKDDFPFRYTTYVGDGDSNVYANIKAHTPSFYGEDFPIVKEECVFHFRKRCKNHITTSLDTASIAKLKIAIQKKHQKDQEDNNTNEPLNFKELSKNKKKIIIIFHLERKNIFLQ